MRILYNLISVMINFDNIVKHLDVKTCLGRLQNPTTSWPVVLSGSGQFQLLLTMTTVWNQTEPPVKRRLSSEVAPGKYDDSKLHLYTSLSNYCKMRCCNTYYNYLYVVVPGSSMLWLGDRCDFRNSMNIHMSISMQIIY